MLQTLLQQLKSKQVEHNVIFPKKDLKQFLIMTILILKENKQINKNDIFQYLENDKFIIPNNFETLDKAKQDKYLNSLKEMVNILDI